MAEYTNIDFERAPLSFLGNSLVPHVNNLLAEEIICDVGRCVLLSPFFRQRNEDAEKF